LAIEGELIHIIQSNGANTNGVTAQLTIEDYGGYEIWDGTAKAHDAQHSHEFVSARRVLVNLSTLKCTISADPGTGGFEVNVILFIYGKPYGAS